MRGPIFVGECPSRAKNAGTRRRLNRWLASMEILDHEFMNCSVDPDWDKKFSSVEADRLINKTSGRPVVALGNAVSSVLSRMGVEHFKMPHPSGRNRLLNDPVFEMMKLCECREYIEAYSAPVNASKLK